MQRKCLQGLASVFSVLFKWSLRPVPSSTHPICSCPASLAFIFHFIRGSTFSGRSNILFFHSVWKAQMLCLAWVSLCDPLGPGLFYFDRDRKKNLLSTFKCWKLISIFWGIFAHITSKNIFLKYETAAPVLKNIK